jgi:uncharacterized damage-inducible protein DinB
LTHPLVEQLFFTRSEFIRSIQGISEEDAQKRILPMNCISWNVGHLAWQEQKYYLTYARGITPREDIQKDLAKGAPASTPTLKEMLEAWEAITREADSWLKDVSDELLLQQVVLDGKTMEFTYGNVILRTIYHYWYHTGENCAIRQMLGHTDLPNFVGDLDGKAPYRPE